MTWLCDIKPWPSRCVREKSPPGPQGLSASQRAGRSPDLTAPLLAILRMESDRHHRLLAVAVADSTNPPRAAAGRARRISSAAPPTAAALPGPRSARQVHPPAA